MGDVFEVDRGRRRGAHDVRFEQMIRTAWCDRLTNANWMTMTSWNVGASCREAPRSSAASRDLRRNGFQRSNDGKVRTDDGVTFDNVQFRNRLA